MGRLGDIVAQLPAGEGFGEYAVLSVNKKYRSASAVADAGSLLFVVYEDCYKFVWLVCN